MNLIVTCARNFEFEAKHEITKFLNELGDGEPDIEISDLSGILTVSTTVNPLKVVESIREKIIEEPWAIRYSLRIIPIQSVANTEIEQIIKEVKKNVGVIKENESYRITVEKRNSNLSTNEIISSVAKIVPNKVSLEKPDWIILIEIISDKTGISIIKDGLIFSLDRTKRSLSD